MTLSISNSQGTRNLFEIERLRDRERKIGYCLHEGTETLVQGIEKFEIEGVRDRESQLYVHVLLVHAVKWIYISSKMW